MHPGIMEQRGVMYYPTGSREICNPPVLDTDEDWLVYAPTRSAAEFRGALVNDGWVTDSVEYDGVTNFMSWRKDNVNLIVTANRYFYERSILATKLAKRFNLTDKEDRCFLFGALRGDITYANL